MSIADKLTYLQTTKQLLKTEINKINNVLDDDSTFRSYPQELFNGYLDILNNGTGTLWNNLEKVSASGEEATLENVETAPMKIDLKGNTSQEADPTPDDPKDIKVVTGENVVSVSGKNLFSSEMELGAINNNTGEPTTSNLGIRTKDFIEVSPDTEYTISNDKAYHILIYEYDENKNIIQYVGNFVNPKTFTTSLTTKYIKVRTATSYGTEVDTTTKYQLEHGSTATPYVPYSKTDYPINLGTLELCKIGDYQDYLYKNNGKWYVHKEIGKKIFDGTETWNISGTNTADVYRMQTAEIKNYILPPTATSIPVYALCSRFIVKSADDTYKKIEGTSSSSVGNIHIYMNDYNTSTSVTDFKTWLSTHNVTLYYVLATPTEEEITNTTLIEQLEVINNAKSVKDKTYITQTNDELPFILDVEAIKEYEVV